MSIKQKILAGLVLGLLSFLVGSSSFSTRLDRRLQDSFFALRHYLGWSSEVDKRIVLIELDDATFETLGQPVSRWADDYAQAIRHLFDSGAKIVGFDLLYHPRLSKLPEADRDQILEEIQSLALLALEENLVITDYFRQKGDKQIHSHEILQLAAESQDNVAFNNLHTDSDGVVRSLGLFFYNEEPRRNRNWAGRIAELADGRSILAKDLPTEEGHGMRINYPGPPEETFRRLSFHKAWKGELPELEGAICLIGPAYEASGDIHNIPFHSKGTWGVEVQAAALNTILKESFIESLPQHWNLLACLLLGAAAALLGGLVSPLILVPCGVLFVLGYLGLAFLNFSLAQKTMALVGPLCSICLSGTLTSLAKYRSLEGSRRYVSSILGRFVSPQVMEELLASPENLQLGGRRRRITVLFTDINNFTPLCEKCTPEEVIAMLNEFFNEMLEIIFRYNGTVKQFVGDEIMVMYGAPNTMDDHAKRAVLTARDMVIRLNELKERAQGKKGFYEVKVGIHTGEVVVGNIGNQRRSEYAAVGDPVNTAARIEALTKSLGEAILLSDETKRECAKDLAVIDFVSKGKQKFKGKEDEMEVFGIRWD